MNIDDIVKSINAKNKYALYFYEQNANRCLLHYVGSEKDVFDAYTQRFNILVDDFHENIAKHLFIMKLPQDDTLLQAIQNSRNYIAQVHDNAVNNTPMNGITLYKPERPLLHKIL